jgi:hypothetical protein
MNSKRVFYRIFAVMIGLGFILSLIPISALGSSYPQLSIGEIQGDSWSTPYYKQTVETTGIVTADYQYGDKRGFFLQDPVGDGNPKTSDGIFVYAPYYYGLLVELGDEITIVARVTEYYGFTELDYVKSITVLSTGNELPESIELNPPFSDYWSDVYYESLEGMLVISSDLTVIQGTDKYGEFAGIRSDLGIDRVFHIDTYGTGEIIYAADDGGLTINVRSGQVIKNLVGPLDYTFSQYRIQPSLDNEPKILPKFSGLGLSRGLAESHGLSIATYNMLNLFDDIVDPGKLQTPSASSLLTTEELDLKISKLARSIHDYLREPDLIAVQEVEKADLLERIAETSSIKADYGVVFYNGPDERGINVGLMYRTDAVKVLDWESRQTCTTNDDGLGPGTDPNYSCVDGQNPLFSRRPLVVHLEDLKSKSDFYVIVNHFKSKSEGEAVTEPRRIEQASFVGSLVQELQADNPNVKVIVLGDLNDFQDSTVEQTLLGYDLYDLIFKVDEKQRYTFIYDGVSEVLDHMLITPSLKKSFDNTYIAHFNPDFPYLKYADDPNSGLAASDHDVIISSFNFGHHHR